MTSLASRLSAWTLQGARLTSMPASSEKIWDAERDIAHHSSVTKQHLATLGQRAAGIDTVNISCDQLRGALAAVTTLARVACRHPACERLIQQTLVSAPLELEKFVPADQGDFGQRFSFPIARGSRQKSGAHQRQTFHGAR